MRHAVIMAGGAGTRLWPLSRRERPKQLMRLFDGASLLELARRRLAGLFEPENVWVVTAARYLDQVAAALPDVPRENLIGEPEGRDTANAIGLAAGLLARRDSDATMAVFTADHLISPREPFASAISAGLAAAEHHPESLITFGIVPTSAHTGYGYLRRGAVVAGDVYVVREFKEKPARDVAELYVASGEYYWNSGMFAWRVAAIRRELARCLPDNAGPLDEVVAAWGTPAAAERFRTLPRISIDYGVMERAGHVLLVEMRCQWLDLGSWNAVAQTSAPDADGNVTLAPEALVASGQRNVLVSETPHLLVVLGASDLIVVHSDDATLVCHRAHEQTLKDLVALRQARFGERYE